MRILVVEDEEVLGENLQLGLSQEGYVVDWLTDGEKAEQALKLEDFDLIILDLGLPKKDGLEVLINMRARGQSTPVIILTANADLDKRVIGLDAGADDYISKPFGLEELYARVRALKRRSVGRSATIIKHGTMTVDPSSHRVSVNDEPVHISPREFALLEKLLDSCGRVLSREQLAQSLYGWEKDIDSNAVEVHIHNLRKKLGENIHIKTVRGVGYMIEKLNG